MKVEDLITTHRTLREMSRKASHEQRSYNETIIIKVITFVEREIAEMEVKLETDNNKN